MLREQGAAGTLHVLSNLTPPAQPHSSTLASHTHHHCHRRLRTKRWATATAHSKFGYRTWLRWLSNRRKLLFTTHPAEPPAPASLPRRNSDDVNLQATVLVLVYLRALLTDCFQRFQSTCWSTTIPSFARFLTIDTRAKKHPFSPGHLAHRAAHRIRSNRLHCIAVQAFLDTPNF
jgi:hypothetical protein